VKSSPDRRRYDRLQIIPNTYAAVTAGSPGQRITFRAKIHDASPTGIRLILEAPVVFAPGPLEIQWVIPAALNPSGAPQTATLTGEVVRHDNSLPEGQMIGVRFSGLISEQWQEAQARVPKVCIAAACVILAGAIAALKIHNLVWFWYAPLYQLYSVVVAALFFHGC